jgi:quinol-cytochrome oxidoreductase complex cytochrome b subunit
MGPGGESEPRAKGTGLRQTELYRSVIRRPSPNRSHNNFLFHVYPVRVPERALSLKATGRLGFISIVLFAILTITGTYLMFFYRPQAPQAYFDMHEIHTRVVFGQVVRNMHRWAAHLMVVVVFIHMIRVYWSGAYKRPRQFNWVIGMGLLLLTLFLSFTGYLLPWDQLALWAVTVGTNLAGYIPAIGENVRQALLGSPDVGDPALIRFYTLHIYVLPLLTLLLIGVHAWRVRKDGFAVGDRLDPDPEEAASDD